MASTKRKITCRRPDGRIGGRHHWHEWEDGARSCCRCLSVERPTQTSDKPRQDGEGE